MGMLLHFALVGVVNDRNLSHSADSLREHGGWLNRIRTKDSRLLSPANQQLGEICKEKENLPANSPEFPADPLLQHHYPAQSPISTSLFRSHGDDDGLLIVTLIAVMTQSVTRELFQHFKGLGIRAYDYDSNPPPVHGQRIQQQAHLRCPGNAPLKLDQIFSFSKFSVRSLVPPQ